MGAGRLSEQLWVPCNRSTFELEEIHGLKNFPNWTVLSTWSYFVINIFAWGHPRLDQSAALGPVMQSLLRDEPK